MMGCLEKFLDSAEFLDLAERASRAGGEIAITKFGKAIVREKAPGDYVTDADLAAQKEIESILLAEFPEFGFLGEEDVLIEIETDRPTWIVDPLDGTGNYVKGIPFYAVAIALMYLGKVLVGVIYDPVHDECFRAAFGKRAFLGTQRLQVSSVTDLKNATIVASLPAGRQNGWQAVSFQNLFGCNAAIQRTGSAALNFSYVSSGRFDVFVSVGLKLWDTAAGELLVEEAGGRCSRLETAGDPIVIASNAALHDDVLESVQGMIERGE